MTDDNGTPRGRILEAVLIAVLTAAGTKLVEALAERLAKRPKKRRKRRRPPDVPEEEGAYQPDPLYPNDPWHVYPVNEGHFTDGEPCWCKPTIEVQPGGGRVIIHRGQVA